MKLGQTSVLELGRLVEVVFSLGALDVCRDGFNLLTQLLHAANRTLFLFPLGAQRFKLAAQLGKLLLQRGQTLLGKRVGLLFECRLLNLVLDDAAGDDVELGGHGVHLGADERAGLVDQVDGLVGKETVGDVAVGQNRRRHQGAVLNLDAVEDLVPLLQAAQDADGVLHRRLVDQHGLEAPLERRVFFNILAVFVEGRGADAVQLAARQHGLEQVAGVNGAVRRAGTHDGVQLVDEEDDAPLALLDFLKHRLQTLFKFATEFRAGNQSAHVERENGLVAQPVGHVAAHDTLGQPFGNGRLANTGFAD